MTSNRCPRRGRHFANEIPFGNDWSTVYVPEPFAPLAGNGFQFAVLTKSAGDKSGDLTPQQKALEFLFFDFVVVHRKQQCCTDATALSYWRSLRRYVVGGLHGRDLLGRRIGVVVENALHG